MLGRAATEQAGTRVGTLRGDMREAQHGDAEGLVLNVKSSRPSPSTHPTLSTPS